MVVVHTIKDLCRRLTEADQVIDQRNAMLSDFWKQEPVMWVMPDGKIVDKHGLGFYKGTNPNDRTPLYTTPPAAPVQEQFGPQEILQMIVDRTLEKSAAQRQWVGLSDDEIIQCTPTWGGTVEDVARAIEAKLKEKNT